MVTEVAAETARVSIENVAAVAPAATITCGGTSATELLLLDNNTAAPPAGAARVITTLFAVVGVPAFAAVGERVSDDRTLGYTLRVAVRVIPAKVALIRTLVNANTGLV
jgi:hypothetical protein